MFLVETLAGFDALALGVIVGSAGMIAGFLWFLIDNRQFEGFKPAANGTRDLTGSPVASDAPSATKHAPAQGLDPRARLEPRGAVGRQTGTATRGRRGVGHPSRRSSS